MENMENKWKIDGESMEYRLKINGKQMENVWKRNIIYCLLFTLYCSFLLIN
jgi:hypothetical protein